MVPSFFLLAVPAGPYTDPFSEGFTDSPGRGAQSVSVVLTCHHKVVGSILGQATYKRQPTNV